MTIKATRERAEKLGLELRESPRNRNYVSSISLVDNKATGVLGYDWFNKAKTSKMFSGKYRLIEINKYLDKLESK